MTWLFAGLALAVVAGTAAMTAFQYRELPARVPLHFALDGTVDGYGPRWCSWLLVILQVGILYTQFSHDGSAKPLGSAILGVCVLAVCWRAQYELLNAARGVPRQMPPIMLYIFMVSMITIGVLAAALIR